MFCNSELKKQSTALQRFALRLTGNSHDADDLVQSTFVKALENREKFTSGTNLQGWCSKIMYNLFVTGYRRQKRFGSVFAPQQFIDSATEPGREYHYACCAELQDAWQNLDKKHRTVLNRHCFDGWRYQDIAESLDVPIGTVRSRVHRARQQLSQYV